MLPVPVITPCLDSKELHVDSEVVNAGLSAISVKRYDAGDPKGAVISIRPRNSFWSVHRPELSKLRWTSNCTPQMIEKHLEDCAAGSKCSLNKQKRIFTVTDKSTDKGEDCLTASESKIIRLVSDQGLASRTILHKCHAKVCTRPENSGQCSIDDIQGPCNSRIVSEGDASKERILRESQMNVGLVALLEPLNELHSSQ